MPAASNKLGSVHPAYNDCILFNGTPSDILFGLNHLFSLVWFENIVRNAAGF